MTERRKSSSSRQWCRLQVGTLAGDHRPKKQRARLPPGSSVRIAVASQRRTIPFATMILGSALSSWQELSSAMRGETSRRHRHAEMSTLWKPDHLPARASTAGRSSGVEA